MPFVRSNPCSSESAPWRPQPCQQHQPHSQGLSSLDVSAPTRDFPLTSRIETPVRHPHPLHSELCSHPWYTQGVPGLYGWCLHGWAAGVIVQQTKELWQPLCNTMSRLLASSKPPEAARQAGRCVPLSPQERASDTYHPPFLEASKGWGSAGSDASSHLFPGHCICSVTAEP